MTPAEIERLLPWSEPSRVQTSVGPRFLRKASPNELFYDAWTRRKNELKSGGVTLVENKRTMALEVCWWRPVPIEILEAERKAIASSSAHDADIAVPCRDGMSFRGYQKAGIKCILDRLKDRAACLVGDAPGLGKTPMSVGVINSEPKICRVLIICPAKLTQNWVEELGAWLSRPMSIGVVEAGCFPSTDIVICSFKRVHKFEKSLSFYWDLIIIDEAHQLKNKDTLQSKHIFGYRPKRGCKDRPISPIPTRRKMALTGTPIPNRVIEIFPTLHWLDPQTWGDGFKFGLRYCDGKNYKIGKKRIWDFKGGSNLDELRNTLRATLLLRRLKSDVMSELPPKIHQLVELENDTGLTGQLEWEAVLKKVKRKNTDDAWGLDSQDAFTRSVGMAEDDLKIAFQDLAEFRHKSALAKVDPFIEEVHERMEEIDKVVIFGHHRDCIERLMVAFKQYNPVQIVGGTKDPQGAARRFQTDPKCRMIIGSDSMMEGFTLTAASTAFFFEGDWVPGKMTQKADRLHRFGQHDSVHCLYFVLKNSVDARMIKHCLKKEEIIGRALDEPGQKPEPPRIEPPKPVYRPQETIVTTGQLNLF